jgi:hypothetical protein
MRQDQRMPRYTLRYTYHFRKLAFESGVVLEDCPIEELDTHIADFRQTYGSEPVVYIGGNNLEPLAISTTPLSQRPLKVVSRQGVDQITCDWDERFSLPFRCMTSVWETVVLLRVPSLKDAPSAVSLPLPLSKRLHDMLFDIYGGAVVDKGSNAFLQSEIQLCYVRDGRYGNPWNSISRASASAGLKPGFCETSSPHLLL